MSLPTYKIRSEEVIGFKDVESGSATWIVVGCLIITFLVLSTSAYRITTRPSRIGAAIGGEVPFIPTRNNVAFAMMHKGLLAEAKAVLQAEIYEGGADAFVFANYGGILAAEGDFHSAEKYIEIARTLAIDDHAKAVVLLNEAMLAHALWEEDRREELIGKATELSREIPDYCSYSVLLRGDTPDDRQSVV